MSEYQNSRTLLSILFTLCTHKQQILTQTIKTSVSFHQREVMVVHYWEEGETLAFLAAQALRELEARQHLRPQQQPSAVFETLEIVEAAFVVFALAEIVAQASIEET